MSKITRMDTPVADWLRVLNAARRTVGKKPMPAGHKVSDGFKRQILLAEHSPIRLLEYDFTWEEIKQWVTVHIVRHFLGCEKFVHSQRDDRRDNPVPRDEMPQGALNDMDMTCNAQSFINISRKRLCAKASPETRTAWRQVVEFLREKDPILAEKCVPNCLYRGFCPEKPSCGYAATEQFKKDLEEYRRME